MKDTLILVGAGFLAFHFLKNKTLPMSNPSADGNQTFAQSSVSNSVPLPSAHSPGGIPVSHASIPAGRTMTILPISAKGLGTDSALAQKASLPLAPDALAHYAPAFERADYSHGPRFNNQMIDR
jgi:hypothetical protein